MKLKALEIGVCAFWQSASRTD